jgi:hypothetical protein
MFLEAKENQGKSGAFHIVGSAVCGAPVESSTYVARTGVSRHFTRDGGSQSFMTTYPTARISCRLISVPAAFLKSSSLKE